MSHSFTFTYLEGHFSGLFNTHSISNLLRNKEVVWEKQFLSSAQLRVWTERLVVNCPYFFLTQSWACETATSLTEKLVALLRDQTSKKTFISPKGHEKRGRGGILSLP